MGIFFFQSDGKIFNHLISLFDRNVESQHILVFFITVCAPLIEVRTKDDGPLGLIRDGK